MKKLSLILALFLLLVLTVIGPTTAQDMMGYTYCGDLPQADCDLLMASAEAMKGVHSSTIDFNMNFQISDVPDMPFENLALGLAANGAFAIDPALMDMMSSMQADPMQFADPQAGMALVGDLIEGISGDFTITINLPPELAAMGGPDANIPETLSFDFRMVDGVAYVNLDQIAEAIPDADVPPGWMGADISSLFAQMSDMGMDSAAMLDQEAMAEYMQSIMNPETMSAFLTIERVDDGEAMGQTLAVFKTTFDFAAFIQSDAYQNFLNAQMELAMGDAEVSAEDQAEIDEVMGMMMGAMEGIVFEQTTAVGLDDHYVHETTLFMSWDLGSFISAIEPEADASEALLTIDASAHVSDFNSDVTVAVPEDATLIPLGGMIPSTDAM